MSETTAEELLSAVRQFLREQVLPELQARVNQILQQVHDQ